MGKQPGMPSVSPYDGQGGRCSYCQINIPRQQFAEEIYTGIRGAFRHKHCGHQIRLFPRVSGKRHDGKPGKLRREQSIKRIE